jgi:hypothetical protein
MTPGTTYSFKVSARNYAGLGAESDPISVLAAQEPDPVINLTNVPG